MATKQYDNYADLITFTRASSGTALRRVGYGAELVTNGDFSNGTTGWATRGTATISYSAVEDALEVNVTGSGGGFEENQSLITEIGKIYLVSITIKKTTFSGNIHWNIDGTNYGSFTPTTDYQTFSKAFVATDTSMDVGFPRENSPTGVYFVREVSVKEVIFDQSTDPLVLFNHPTNVPRIEYDADGNRLGLLIEEARTNLLVQSEDFGTDAGWSWTRSTVTENAIAAPDGATTADYLEQASGQTGAGSVARSLTISGSGDYTWSVFAKAAEKTFTRLQLTPSNYAHFNLSTGVTGTAVGCTASITDCGSGWYRCSITASLSANPFALFYVGDTDNSLSVTDSGGIYLWGGMFEAGSFATSYIGTSGATAARSADVASIPTSAFGYNSKVGAGGTVIADFQSDAWTDTTNTQFFRVWNLNPTSGSGLFKAGQDDSQFRYRLNDTSNNAVFGPDTIPSNEALSSSGAKIAIAYAKDDFALYSNGTQSAIDTGGLFANQNVTHLYLGSENGTSNFANGHIKSIQYFPRRLTNAQLVRLTS